MGETTIKLIQIRRRKRKYFTSVMETIRSAGGISAISVLRMGTVVARPAKWNTR